MFSISNVFDFVSFLTYMVMAVVKYQYSYWKAGRTWEVFDLWDPLFDQSISEYLSLVKGGKISRKTFFFKKNCFSHSLSFFLSCFLNSCNPMPLGKQRAEHPSLESSPLYTERYRSSRTTYQDFVLNKWKQNHQTNFFFFQIDASDLFEIESESAMVCVCVSERLMC